MWRDSLRINLTHPLSKLDLKPPTCLAKDVSSFWLGVCKALESSQLTCRIIAANLLGDLILPRHGPVQEVRDIRDVDGRGEAVLLYPRVGGVLPPNPPENPLLECLYPVQLVPPSQRKLVSVQRTRCGSFVPQTSVQEAAWRQCILDMHRIVGEIAASLSPQTKRATGGRFATWQSRTRSGKVCCCFQLGIWLSKRGDRVTCANSKLYVSQA